jgi:hypothetical protein
LMSIKSRNIIGWCAIYMEHEQIVLKIKCNVAQTQIHKMCVVQKT